VEQVYWLDAAIKEPRLARWYFHWRSSLDGRHSPLDDELPWITYGAINWLASHLTKEMTIFEWGSGGSTMFFARRAKQVITIEHDPGWYQKVNHVLQRKPHENVFFRLIEPMRSENIDAWYISTDSRYIGHSFEQYIKTIDTYSDGFFDIVVVDGRARPGCIRHAIAKIKKGGYLVLDNSERIEYQTGWNLVQEWKNVKIWGPGPYNGYPWETRIWQKSSI